MKIILYTSGCPKCVILEKRLKEKGIEYITETDVDVMLDMGLTTVPYIKVDEELMNFSQANEWINMQ